MNKTHKIKLRFTKSRKRQKRLMKEAHARPYGSAELFASSGLVIMQDGSFNVDVLIDTDLKDPTQGKDAHAISGRLDEDSLDYLIELGVIRPAGRAPAAKEEEEVDPILRSFADANETDTPGS